MASIRKLLALTGRSNAMPWSKVIAIFPETTRRFGEDQLRRRLQTLGFAVQPDCLISE
jgi:hypothetical protein